MKPQSMFTALAVTLLALLAQVSFAADGTYADVVHTSSAAKGGNTMQSAAFPHMCSAVFTGTPTHISVEKFRRVG